MGTILVENKMENLADAAFEERIIRSRCIEDRLQQKKRSP